VNNPTPEALADAEPSEEATRAQFVKDPYGVRIAPPDSSPKERRDYLGEKRRDRNPIRRHAPYPVSCPALERLLAHDSTDVFNGELPW
jgi:hypothetical protein